jgi:hypothetical protein
MSKLLQLFLFLFVFCALVVSMAKASVTLALYWQSIQPQNYLGYRLAESLAGSLA